MKMPVNAHRNDFPKNVPEPLICALREAGSERALSRRLGVNISYVSQLLQRGIEPTSKTANGRKVRAKLFLPGRTYKKADEHTKRIRRKVNRMARETKKALEMKQ